MAKKGHSKKHRFGKTHGKVIARSETRDEATTVVHKHKWTRVTSRMFKCECFACIMVIWDLIYSRDVIEKYNRYGWRSFYM